MHTVVMAMIVDTIRIEHYYSLLLYCNTNSPAY